MAAFEWMELQTLTGEITVARARLAAARSGHDHRRVRLLEQEIVAAEGRRARLLALLTNHLADAAPPAMPQSAYEDTPSAAAEMAQGVTFTADEIAEATLPDAAEIAAGAVRTADEIAEDAAIAADETGRPAAPDPAQRVARGAAVAANAAENFGLEGGNIVWEQLTPGDLERAEQELGKRREEMLARHAEELKALDADHDRLASLEQAIAEFIQRFGRPSGDGGEIVLLGDERELRAAGRG